MAINKGFNFRNTSGYVTDGANETYVLGSDEYPVTRGGVTFGWDSTSSIGGRDRDSGIDVRLAGQNQRSNNGGQNSFRVDLDTATDHEITLANGDTGFGQGYQYWQFKDNTSVLRTVDDSDGTLVNNYNDATGINRTEAAWPGDNVKDTQTFTSTIFNLLIATPSSQSDNTTIAHLFLSEAAGGVTGKSNPLYGPLGGPLYGPLG